MDDRLDDLIAFGDFDEDDEEEDRVECCIQCGKPLPIEGFCCEDECLRVAVEGPAELGYCDRHRWLHEKDSGPTPPCKNWSAAS